MNNMILLIILILIIIFLIISSLNKKENFIGWPEADGEGVRDAWGGGNREGDAWGGGNREGTDSSSHTSAVITPTCGIDDNKCGPHYKNQRCTGNNNCCDSTGSCSSTNCKTQKTGTNRTLWVGIGNGKYDGIGEVCKKSCFEKNTDYYSNNTSTNYGISKNSPQECQDLCKDTPKCNYWSFDNKSKICYPKTSDYGKTNSSTPQKEGITNPGGGENYTSGPRICPADNKIGKCAQKDVDYYSHNIKGVSDGIPAEDYDNCQELCKNSRECKYWSWTGDPQGKCYLKTSDAGETPKYPETLEKDIDGKNYSPHTNPKGGVGYISGPKVCPKPIESCPSIHENVLLSQHNNNLIDRNDFLAGQIDNLQDQVSQSRMDSQRLQEIYQRMHMQANEQSIQNTMLEKNEKEMLAELTSSLETSVTYNLENIMNNINNLENIEQYEIQQAYNKIKSIMKDIVDMQNEDNTADLNYLKKLVTYIGQTSQTVLTQLNMSYTRINKDIITKFENIVATIKNYNLLVSEVIYKERENTILKRQNCKNSLTCPSKEGCHHQPLGNGMYRCDLNYTDMVNQSEHNIDHLKSIFDLPAIPEMNYIY